MYWLLFVRAKQRIDTTVVNTSSYRQKDADESTKLIRKYVSGPSCQVQWEGMLPL